MTPRRTRSKNDKPELPTNPITLALRVQEGKCPSCEKRGTMTPVSKPMYRETLGGGGYMFNVAKCSTCTSEWVERYVLSEVSLILLPPKEKSV